MEEDVNHQPDPQADVPTEQPKDNGRGVTILLLVVAILSVLGLIGLVAVQRFDIPNPFAAAPAPTATTEPSPTATPPPPAAQATATPTRVVAVAEPSPTPQPTATDMGLVTEPSPTPQPTATDAGLAAEPSPTPQPTATDAGLAAEPSPTPQPTATDAGLVPEETDVGLDIIVEPVIGERVRNGSFEDGFENQIIGQGWTSFNNGAAIFEFLEETWSPAVFDGERAQRIQVREASQPDRYAGIYQTVSVVPGETYNLTLNGQIRSGEGDIQASQYGYRMQLGIDDGGGQDWTAVEDWVELPWDEQRFDSDSLFFYDYSTPVATTGSQLTIFIRSWNKWPDPGRVEYTVDAISLTGLVPSEEIVIDKALPVTGGPPLSASGRVRLLASAVMLCVLVAAGAVRQFRRQFG